MKKWPIRLISLIAMSSLVITSMAGCTSTRDKEATPTPTATTVSEETAKEIIFPLEEKVTLSIGAPDSTRVSLANQLPVWSEIERKTGVSVDWDLVAAVQYDQVMKLRIAAGTKELPDIMLLPNGINMTELGQEGIILPLENLIEKHAPNIKKLYESYPNLKALTTSPEGHTYTINGLNEPAYFAPFTFIVRKDWLDKLNLQEPQTIDEWYQVLKAFKENDPNGNGKKDEVPYSVGGHVWWLMNWGHAWGLHLFQTSGWYPDKEGKMELEFTNSKVKDFYSWLNKIYADGLLDKEFLTMGSEDKLYEKVTRNIVGAFPAYPSMIPQLEKALVANGVKDAYLKPMLPPKGPNGEQMVEVIGDMSVNGFMVTSNCKNPDLAIKYIDFVYASKEGQDLMNFGIEGWTYTRADDGSYVFTDEVTKDSNGRTPSEVLQDFGCQVGFPYVASLKREEALLYNMPERTKKDLIEYTDKTKPYALAGLILPPTTEDEEKSISGVGGDLFTYIWEMSGKFVLGIENLDKWHDYVNKINSLGVDKITEVKQAQYDRLRKNK